MPPSPGWPPNRHRPEWPRVLPSASWLGHPPRTAAHRWAVDSGPGGAAPGP
ncbi:hypothetical protein ACFFX0_27250 [Citricoccus parietis]|uniref:Uncharacterized protein n=1 Tax=Citricoccus parietis TaxID=592307 RepID=A0ABV5G6V4_9MICC